MLWPRTRKTREYWNRGRGSDTICTRKWTKREALREMDKKGISPTVVARNLFGIGTAAPGESKKAGNTLIEDAEKTVRKSTEKFFSAMWNGFLNTLGGLIETGLSVFSGKGGK